MGKKKNDTTTTATYTPLPHVATADENAYRDSVQNADFHSGIVNAYGQAANDINDTTFEEALPAGAAERIKYGRMFNLQQQKGAALSDAASREAQFKSAGMGNLAGMTQSQYAQTGGTNNNTQTGFFGPAFASSFGSQLGGGLGGA